jgi:putative endonuclease
LISNFDILDCPGPEALEGTGFQFNELNMKGYMYILECRDRSYYVGSTNNLERRLAEHMSGFGANHTKKRLPVRLIYYEEYQRIDEAFYREKQVQGWSRKKKEALIKGQTDLLPKLALAYRDMKTFDQNLN